MNIDKVANLRDSARKITQNLRSLNRIKKLSHIEKEVKNKSRDLTIDDIKADDRGSTYLEILFMNAAYESEPVD